MEKLHALGVGPEGQLAKLEGVSVALKYLSIKYCDRTKEGFLEFQTSMTVMEAKLDSWKRQLRRQKKKLSLQRLDALSISSLTLADVTKVGRFDRAVKKARAGEDAEDLKFSMGACALALLYKNWQRQGVVMHMLQSEYESKSRPLSRLKSRRQEPLAQPK